MDVNACKRLETDWEWSLEHSKSNTNVENIPEKVPRFTVGFLHRFRTNGDWLLRFEHAANAKSYNMHTVMISGIGWDLRMSRRLLLIDCNSFTRVYIHLQICLRLVPNVFTTWWDPLSRAPISKIYIQISNSWGILAFSYRRQAIGHLQFLLNAGVPR